MRHQFNGLSQILLTVQEDLKFVRTQQNQQQEEYRALAQKNVELLQQLEQRPPSASAQPMATVLGAHDEQSLLTLQRRQDKQVQDWEVWKESTHKWLATRFKEKAMESAARIRSELMAEIHKAKIEVSTQVDSSIEEVKDQLLDTINFELDKVRE